jgi:Uma2 family endonuclease
MGLVKTVGEVEYPESDGMPMGETELHQDWMLRIRDILRLRYHGQRVYVASNLLVYYEEGEPSKYVVPDDFVVKDCDPHRRRTFKIWEERRVPDVVFEVTSRSSRHEYEGHKPQVYGRLGVKEYFLYDPTSEYLRPPLQGFRLVQGDYTRMTADDSGALKCDELDITLRLEQGELVIYDGRSGKVLQTAAEAAEARAAELEAEVRRLRSELRRRPSGE